MNQFYLRLTADHLIMSSRQYLDSQTKKSSEKYVIQGTLQFNTYPSQQHVALDGFLNN